MNEMDSKDMKLFIFNLKLVRLTGLYQILGSSGNKDFGLNVYRTIVIIFIVISFIISLISSLGLYNTMNDTTTLTYNMGCVGNIMFSSYKMITILYYSNDIWRLFNTNDTNGIPIHQYNANVFKNWKKRTHNAITGYFIISFLPFLIWCLSPYIFNDTTVNIRNHDGTFSKFQLSCVNLFFILPVNTYNTYFSVFYLVEVIFFYLYFYFSFLFDTLTILISFSLSCQLESIGDRIKLLGYNSYDNDDMKNGIYLGKKYNLCDQLKFVIIDHQYVITKMNDYYNIIRIVQGIQIFVASISQIMVWFIAAMSFSVQEKEGDSILSIKLFTCLPVFSFHLFFTCMMYGTINERKDSIIFELYNSNWTDMDIQSKKIILYAMKMNNANQLKLKYTNTKIINLEMFTGSMRICYSVFSMLVNYKKNKIN